MVRFDYICLNVESEIISCTLILKFFFFFHERCILVSSGFHYKIPHTEWLKHVNLFSHDSRDSKVQEQDGSRGRFLWGLFLACRQPPSHYVSTWTFLGAQREREWVRSLSSLIWALVLPNQGPSHDLMWPWLFPYKQIQLHWMSGLQHVSYEETPTLSH